MLKQLIRDFLREDWKVCLRVTVVGTLVLAPLLLLVDYFGLPRKSISIFGFCAAAGAGLILWLKYFSSFWADRFVLPRGKPHLLRYMEEMLERMHEADTAGVHVRTHDDGETCTSTGLRCEGRTFAVYWFAYSRGRWRIGVQSDFDEPMILFPRSGCKPFKRPDVEILRMFNAVVAAAWGRRIDLVATVTATEAVQRMVTEMKSQMGWGWKSVCPPDTSSN